MKPRVKLPGLALAWLALVQPAEAQLPVISSLHNNGQLICTNLLPNSVAVVEWAPSLSGPWTNRLAWTEAVGADSNGIVSVSVPMFFRVRGAPLPTNGMTLIPAGGFTMGNVSGDLDITDAPPVSVYLSGFYVDVNVVSLRLWQTIYTIATNSLGYTFCIPGAVSADGLDYPVHGVGWQDCLKWCNARSQIAGLTPVYYEDAAFTQIYTNGLCGSAPHPNWAANGYRLPTEAEWEKAARGGLSGVRFPWGNTISESQANYFGDTVDYSYDLGPNGSNPQGGGATLPVGSLALNGYGLSDVAGNVQQFVWDFYAPTYIGGTDPRGPTTGSTSPRVARGGYWNGSAGYGRCAYRSQVGYAGPVMVGFRCTRNQ